MGKVKEFIIQINEDRMCMIPDANGCLTVSGNLVVNLAVEVQVKYLKLSFKGESRCRWTEGSGDNRKTRSSLDQLFKEKQAFILSHDSAPTTLTPGSHVYPFIFQIRAGRHLPSTCIGSTYGSITYFLYAKMDRAGIVFDDRVAEPIIVHNPMVLNISQYMTPASFDKEHTDCCLCCASGPAIVEATINRTALTLQSPDKIDVTLNIDNLMGKSLIPRVYLEEVRTFKAGSSTKYCINRLCQVESDVLRPNTRRNLVQVQVGPVVDDVIGSVQSVNNIFVNYRLVVKLKGSRFQMEYPIMMALDGTAGPAASPYQVAMGYAPGPDGSAPYPPAGSAYPPAGAAYPPAGSAYPPAGSAYPPAGSAYSPVNPAYPPVNPAYPPTADKYPDASSAYPAPTDDSKLPPPPAYGSY